MYLCIIILKLNISFLVSFPGQNPVWFSLIFASNFFSLRSRIILRRVVITWLMRLIVLNSEHSKALGFFGLVMNIVHARSSEKYHVLWILLNKSVKISPSSLHGLLWDTLGGLPDPSKAAAQRVMTSAWMMCLTSLLYKLSEPLTSECIRFFRLFQTSCITGVTSPITNLSSLWTTSLSLIHQSRWGTGICPLVCIISYLKA